MPYDISDNEFKKTYHIDHVRPVSSFDLSKPENQFKAFGWPNCSSLLQSKNLSKFNKRNLYIEVLQELKATVFLKLYYAEEY